MLATMISHARRSVGVSTRRVPQRVEEGAHDLDPVAPVVEQQPERAADVEHHDERQPEGLRFCDCALTSSFQPNSVGNSTVCPRLEIGNSSVTPCSTPSTIAWK